MIYDTRFGPHGSFAPNHRPYIRRDFANDLWALGGGEGHFINSKYGFTQRRGSFADSLPTPEPVAEPFRMEDLLVAEAEKIGR
jgi:hypothetical protein